MKGNILNKTKFAVLALISCAIGFHYWELRRDLFISRFKNEIHESEHRILRDELNEIRSKKTYEQGVLDTAIRLNLNSEFADGVFQTVSAFKENNYITAYHNAVEHTSAMTVFQNEQKRKDMILSRKMGYEDGFKDGYHKSLADINQPESHPDYTPPKNTNQTSK